MLLCFEHQVFLVLDMVFSDYNKDPKEPKQVINKINIVFCFTCAMFQVCYK